MTETLAPRRLDRGQKVILLIAIVLTAIAGVAKVTEAGAVPQFVLAGLALGALAAVIGQAIEQVGERLGPSATGLLQSTLGNLPELFVCLFALQEGLIDVVRAALVGSILGNAVLVLGCAFVAGGLRHGTQKFDPEEPRLNASLLLLVVSALLIPTLASEVGSPAAQHTKALSDVCAIVLLVVYAASIPFYLRKQAMPAAAAEAQGTGTGTDTDAKAGPTASLPLSLSVGLLALGSLGAAFASEWFVDPLQEATESLGLSQTFTGLVVVAIASNAVEHAVGIRFALRAKPEFAISTTLNSPLQVALLLTPVLVLASTTVGKTPLTLVFPPLMVASLAIAAVVVMAVVYDGEYTWLEGVALIGLYCIIASAFWWG